jgi:hydroxymethylpyrimidine/phosphomethylpyrimidine kinase
MMALSIAGLDPSGGAGILADVKTFTALGVYPTTVVTALTAQNVSRVASVKAVDPDFVAQQIDLVLEEEDIQHAKTGMLYSPKIVKVVARKVKEYQLNLVVDPVMVAGSGGSLSQANMAGYLKKHLLPLARLATPNIDEAAKLSKMVIKDEKDACEVAVQLGKICPTVVTGGHLDGSDIFYENSLKKIIGKKLDSINTHGSGCTYSAAATAYMVKGLTIEESVRKASYFTKKAIVNGSHGTLNQYWSLKD